MVLCRGAKSSFPAGLVRLTFPVPTLAGVLLRETLCRSGGQGKFHGEKKHLGKS